MKKKVPTLAVRPTQFSIGLSEIEAKVHRFEKMNKRRRKKLVNDTPVPVVLGPDGELYMVDHHHFVLACCHAGIPFVKIKVVANWSRKRLSYHQFWKKMVRSNWAYLYDQFGDGPRSPLYLPNDVRGLADDPYRALAWEVRETGAYQNTNETFAEFKWADFFRKRRLLDKSGRKGFKQARERAIRAAKSRAAARLPGYLGPKR